MEPGESELSNTQKTAKDVSQIQHTAGERFSDEFQIAELVESPLVGAVTEFFCKGILTISSSANVEEGRDNAHILVDWKSLSPENREIARKILGVKDIVPGNWGDIFFSMPITPNTPSNEITRWAEGIAKQFVFQPAAWELRYSVDQLREWHKEDFPKELPPEKISQETGLFLGEDGFFYRNEAAFKRYHGISEATAPPKNGKLDPETSSG